MLEIYDMFYGFVLVSFITYCFTYHLVCQALFSFSDLLKRGTVLPSVLFLFHEAVVSSICNDTILRRYCSTVVMGIINHVTYVFLYSNYFFSVVGIYRYCHCHQIIFSRKNCLTVKFVFHVLLSNLI